MQPPGFAAAASIYATRLAYSGIARWGSGTDAQLTLSQLPLPQGGIVCDGACPPVCHVHCGPCEPNSSVASGCARTCVAFGPNCDNPGSFTSECPASACCPVTCGACTGGSCGTYPSCQPVALSGKQTCTDCHGTVTTRPC